MEPLWNEAERSTGEDESVHMGRTGMRIRRIATLLSTGVLAVGLAIGTGGAAAYANVAPPAVPWWSELFNPLLPMIGDSYRLCMDVPRGSSTPGLRLQMYHCHGYDSSGYAQRWIFEPVGDGYSYRIYNQANLLCVTAMPGGGSGDVQQRACGSQDGQTWRLRDFQTDQNFHLLSTSPAYPNACLASSGNSNNARVIWEVCAQDAFQIWALG
jgi:hypothetical protein